MAAVTTVARARRAVTTTVARAHHRAATMTVARAHHRAATTVAHRPARNMTVAARLLVMMIVAVTIPTTTNVAARLLVMMIVAGRPLVTMTDAGRPLVTMTDAATTTTTAATAAVIDRRHRGLRAGGVMVSWRRIRGCDQLRLGAVGIGRTLWFMKGISDGSIQSKHLCLLDLLYLVIMK